MMLKRPSRAGGGGSSIPRAELSKARQNFARESKPSPPVWKRSTTALRERGGDFGKSGGLTCPGKRWLDVLEVKPDASREAIDAHYRRLAHDRQRGGTHDAMAALNEAHSAGLAARR